MQILIDNKDIETYFSIKVLDYTGALDIAPERANERTWEDKSGVDRNLENIRYDSKEFVLSCYCKANSLIGAYTLVNTLVAYMLAKGVFVLSLRDSGANLRESFLCERSGAIVNTSAVRYQNSLYTFKIGLKDVNPNALKYKNTITLLASSISYTRGQNAVIYWGNGDRAVVTNSGTYVKSDYSANGAVDIIIDIDPGPATAPTVPPIVSAFSASPLSGVSPLSVQFTDATTGSPVIWAWNFGDGETSSEQSPLHVYTNEGTYTVTLQAFNSIQGSDVETKTAYITVRKAQLLINGSDSFLINSTDNLLIN
jgi:hypothetical protein